MLLALLCLHGTAFAREVPALVAHVNDTANMLSEGERAQLEQKLSEYERTSGHQFALLTIDTLDGDALESFSIRVVEAWKLGKKGKDDGVLLLLVKNDHKLRTEVGYGLEGVVTDAFASRVNRSVLVPAMRTGQVGSGIDQAFELLMRKAAGENVTAGENVADGPGRSGQSYGWLTLLFFFSPVLAVWIFAWRRSRNGGGGGWGGGGWGGGGFGGGFGGGGGWGGGSDGGSFSGGGGGFGGGGSSDSW